MSNATTTDTKTQILDATEHLIAEKAFTGTTLRNIASAADVNLAAVHYHFGSKEELFRAAVHRIAKPVVARQLDLLNQLKQKTVVPSVEDLLTAFLKPPLEFISGGESSRIVRAQFMGRCRTEPEPVQSIARQEFSSSAESFLDVLQRALPDQSRSQLDWKLDLVIAALIQVQMQAGKPNALLQSNQPKDIQVAITNLVTFMANGMRSS
ncbi:MAG: TetR/AcrR family transcriptional regulator [Cyanobacteria bacterium P01_D01_bin.115]